ncbi:hypothetical protein ABFA07_015629 [Porites harrisoni]
MRTVERKPSETAEQMRHRVYSRLYGIMWYGCKIGKGKFTGGQPTFVFPKCIKKVVWAIVGENIRTTRTQSGLMCIMSPSKIFGIQSGLQQRRQNPKARNSF